MPVMSLRYLTQIFLTLFLSTSVASTARDERPYLTWLADTFIDDGVKPGFGYQEATLYIGFEQAYDYSKDEKYLDWYKGQIDGHVVQEDGTIKNWDYSLYSLDEYRMGNNYLYLHNITGDDKYKSAAGIVRKQINSHPRTPSGGFWHRKPIFANQMWLDGIFMADSFYARWTHLFDRDNETAWDDIMLQYDIIDSHTRNKTSGLLVHGWAETDTAPWADPVTGRAPHVWGRAVGWYFMSLVEVLQVFPTSHSGYDRLMGYYTSLASALKASQDPPSGSWWQVMDEPYPGREGNYVESSGSAMFTWGLLKGIDLGYLNESDYLDSAKRAYEGLVNNFISTDGDRLLFNKTVAECGLVSSNVTYEYYISVKTTANDFKGAGPFMRASYEWETWAQYK